MYMEYIFLIKSGEVVFKFHIAMEELRLITLVYSLFLETVRFYPLDKRTTGLNDHLNIIVHT